MSSLQIRTDWEPHDGQREVLNSPARFRIVACGRRWGKTALAAREAARCLGTPGSMVWWVAPTYDTADAGFRAVKEALPQGVMEGNPKDTKPKEITLVNGSEISFRSADREDSLRSVGLDLLIIDEAAMVPKRAWTDELRPTLSDTLGEMIAISTPKGRGWFYEWFQHGQADDRDDVESWQQSTYENDHVPDSEIESARKELPERVWRQEYLAEFISETGGVFEQLDERLFTADYTLPSTLECPEWAEGPFATGVDFAQIQDYRVTITLDSQGRVVWFDRGQRESWPQIQHGVEQVAKVFPGVVAVDGSRKNKVVSDLEASGVNVDPITFSAQRKRELIQNLITAIESGDLEAPEMPVLRQELEVFEYDITPSGNARYDAPEGFHDDSVDALALANDVLSDAIRQEASATARLGGSDPGQTDGDALREYAEEWQRRQQGNKWK